jgi:predicted nucleotide-binding protein (sugar kinase/HSP70/actin superfamily)
MPHLGNTYLAAKALFDGMGIDFIVPEFSNREALEIGSKYAPDEICLPFKIMFGNIIQGYKAGADTAIITGSCGPCRYGEYCELFKNTLKKAGCNINLIVVDQPKDIGIKELLRRIGKISEASNKSRNEQIRALFNAYKVIKLIDYIEGTARYLAGYEVEKGQFKKLLQNCKKDAGKCDDPIKMIEVLEKYKRNLKHIKIDKDKDPIRIAIIGEIYTILEPFANLYIEDKLMDYGISVKKGITPSWWIKDAALVPLKANSISIRRASKEYLPLYVGGHARECIGETVLAEKNNMDGVIQIFPLGCMPEIVAKAILPQISKDKNFPIMSLVVDEMTGEAGYATRIEAFIDLLERRKEKCII